MTWSPQYQVIDLSQIADNLLGYIENSQEEALEWAGGPGMTPFAKFYTNSAGRLQTIFPSLMILTQETGTDLTGDILQGGLKLTLEGTISGPNTDELVASTKIYAKAVESMLSNIPSGTFTANSDPEMHSALMEIETRLDVVRGLVGVSGFVQVFQVQCLYKLLAAAF